MIIVLTDKITSRTKYAVSLILGQVLHIDFKLIDNPEQITDACINYSQHNIPNSLIIKKHGLLEENDIKNYNPETKKWRNLPIIFETEKQNKIPFDVFSASFWIASRYEEYSNFVADKHGRFSYKNSHAFKNDYLQIPVINLWALELKKELQNLYPEIKFPELKYQFVPSIDVDSMFKYKYKGSTRNLGGLFRDLLSFKFKDISSRIKTLRGKQNDDWDIFNYITKLHEAYELNPLFFVLCAEKTSKFDKNISINSSAFHKNLEYINSKHRVGLHPSYLGHSSPLKWEKEIKFLNKSIGRSIDEARMHYLKFKLPDTYNKLESLGIKFDFSMAYADVLGFRAGICSPFFFYNLNEEKHTSLSVVPLSIMDTSLIKYMKLKPDEAKLLIKQISDTIKNCKGVFVSLWHNQTFADNYEFIEVYHYLLKEAK
ncbi:MAG: hypothetical protein GX879_11045 [Bacteroidales bacterium]|nr:hypothetical protein [Bacteroidales bacterium]